MFDRLLAAPLVLSLPWAIGQILRDRWWLSGLCFYLPSPLLALALGVAAITLWRRRRSQLAKASLLVALLPAAVTFGVENQWRAPAQETETTVDQAATDPLTLVHWNIFRGFLGWDRIQAELASHPADVYVLSELPEIIRSDRVAVLPGGYSMIRDGLLGVACKGFIEHRTEKPPSPLRLIHAACQVADRELTVLAVDLPSGLHYARRPFIEEVAHWMHHYSPDIVVGDFNAPRRSIGLSPPPEGYAHAYHLAGHGWSYSWPVPIPVMAIDQCFVSRRIQPLGYSLSSHWLSDHRIQTLTFAPPP